jgi:hypothetical protein
MKQNIILAYLFSQVSSFPLNELGAGGILNDPIDDVHKSDIVGICYLNNNRRNERYA